MGYDHQDPNALAVGAFALVILIFTFVCGGFVRAYFHQVERGEYHNKVQATAPAQWDKIKADSQKKLSTYGWVDEAAQTVRLPIDRAIELTVKDLGAKK